MSATPATIAAPSTENGAARGLAFEEVRERLAHRFPFLMIDRVTSLEPGVRLEALKHVSGNDICFLGHFPQKSIMPGVLVLEAMAQALSLLDKESREPGHPAAKYLGRAEVQFLRPVVPGDSMRIEAVMLRQVRFGVLGKVSVKVEGCEVARGEISLGTGQDGEL